MSMWADYVSELRGGDCKFIERDFGFISYSFPKGGTVVFVEDVYIVPERRDASHAFSLLNEVAEEGRKAGRTDLTFIVRTDSPTCATNLRVYLAMGFVPVGAEGGNVWLRRAINKEK